MEWKILREQLKWHRDVPFIFVTPEIFCQFQGHRFTAEEFYKSEIWKNPMYWNSGLFLGERMVVFIYGIWDSLEKDLNMKRLAADRSFQSSDISIINMVLDEVESIGREKGAKIIWTMVTRKGLIRKAIEMVKRGKVNPYQVILENDKF